MQRKTEMMIGAAATALTAAAPALAAQPIRPPRPMPRWFDQVPTPPPG